jgi:hypothetical protein
MWMTRKALLRGVTVVLALANACTSDPPPTPEDEVIVSESGTPDSGRFELPEEASIPVDTGSIRGWDWVLSTSQDGACVALTDVQGSESICNEGPSRLCNRAACPSNPSDFVFDIGVRSPRVPKPPVVVVYGRVPPGTSDVRVDTCCDHDETKGVISAPPPGVDIDTRFFVEWLPGYRYPFVPDGPIDALNEHGDGISLGLERPDWARRPSYTVLDTIASGVVPRNELIDALPWAVDLFRNESTGSLCVGEPGVLGACGPPDDPVPSWMRTWPNGIEFGGGGTQGQPHSMSTSLIWGLIREPIVAVNVERHDASGERLGFDAAELYRLPDPFGEPFTVFVWECSGRNCFPGAFLGLDADGNVVERAA